MNILGHELLHKEVLLDKISETPENYTLTFNYTDKEDQLVTFVKFQINDVSTYIYYIHK